LAGVEKWKRGEALMGYKKAKGKARVMRGPK